MRRQLLAFCLLLPLACAEDRPSSEREALACHFRGREIPAGMAFGADGCNECWCGAVGAPASCDGGVCQAFCTAAPCGCPPPVHEDAGDAAQDSGDSAEDDAGDGGDGGTVEGEGGADTCERIRPCSAQGQCGGRQPCLFDPGCEAPVGLCIHTQPNCGYADEPNVPATNPDPTFSFCGCDGVTYEGACPKIPYRHQGPCS